MSGVAILLFTAWLGIVFIRIHFPQVVLYAYTLPMDIIGICITLGTILLISQVIWKHWKQSSKSI